MRNFDQYAAARFLTCAKKTAHHSHLSSAALATCECLNRFQNVIIYLLNEGKALRRALHCLVHIQQNFGCSTPTVTNRRNIYTLQEYMEKNKIQIEK